MLLTLLIIHQKRKILLGMKKRGFGAGRWNGFGGKVDKEETIQQAALRELEEEAGITALDAVEHGTITFIFDNDPVHLEVHVFSATKYAGNITESDEMAPQWFSDDAIPYENMWADDKLWLPLLLEGKKFEGIFWFKDKDTIRKYDLKEV